MIARRGLLTGLLAMPAIVTVDRIMKVRAPKLIGAPLLGYGDGFPGFQPLTIAGKGYDKIPEIRWIIEATAEASHRLLPPLCISYGP